MGPRFLQSAALLLLPFLLSACTVKLSTKDYEMRMAAGLNELRASIQETVVAYRMEIPSLVSEESEVSTAEMSRAYRQAEASYEGAEALLKLLSEDPIQQEQSSEELSATLGAVNLYLDAYEAALDFYRNGDFKEAPYQATTLDQSLRKQYSTLQLTSPSHSL